MLQVGLTRFRAQFKRNHNWRQDSQYCEEVWAVFELALLAWACYSGGAGCSQAKEGHLQPGRLFLVAQHYVGAAPPDRFRPCPLDQSHCPPHLNPPSWTAVSY